MNSLLWLADIFRQVFLCINQIMGQSEKEFLLLEYVVSHFAICQKQQVNMWMLRRGTVRITYRGSSISVISFNNNGLLMRSTHDHEDRVRYWLPDAVLMAMGRPKSKVHYCFIKLSGISFTHNSKDLLIASESITAVFSRPAEVSLVKPRIHGNSPCAVYSFWGTLE